MDKQKQIEEMAKVIGWDCNNKSMDYCDKVDDCDECRAIYLYNAGYRKIPENAVVLTREELEDMKFTKEHCDLYLENKWLKDCIPLARKELAEKFAERVKNLEEALLDMVVQFCQMENWGELRHTFMSAEEQAFDVLDITYGEKVDDVYERFNKKWNRPIDEICKEITEGVK